MLFPPLKLTFPAYFLFTATSCYYYFYSFFKLAVVAILSALAKFQLSLWKKLNETRKQFMYNKLISKHLQGIHETN